LRRSDSALAPDEQPNPTAKRKEKDMTERKVEARMRMQGESKGGMRFSAQNKEAAEICRSVTVRKTTFDKLGKPKVIEVTIEAVCFEDEQRTRIADDVRQKRCTVCEEWKDESQYYKHGKHIDGLAYRCKLCADKATNKCRQRRKDEAAKPGPAEIEAAMRLA